MASSEAEPVSAGQGGNLPSFSLALLDHKHDNVGN